MFLEMFQAVQEKTPLVHNITNYVTVNDCANIVLACGGSPIMSDDIDDVEDIISICNALVINMGTLNARTISSMVKAGKKANALGKPVILDPVGAGASRLRTETAYLLMKEIKFAVIRGNISEIKTLAQGAGTTKGVDADAADIVQEDNLAGAIALAKNLSQNTGAVVAITGPIDIISDGAKTYAVRNGHPSMGKITGSGCMLTSVIGAYCGANPQSVLEAATTAIGLMGLCGEIAAQKVAPNNATGSFRTYLIDAMSDMNSETLQGGLKIAAC